MVHNMDGKETKACVFAALIVAVYGIHQVTVGGDGIIVATIIGAIAGIGGYVLRGKVET